MRLQELKSLSAEGAVFLSDASQEDHIETSEACIAIISR